MKTRNIFCILAKTGAGKSFYYNKIIEDKEFMEKNNISTLVYGTTRKPRPEEKEGIDYYFYSIDNYNKIPFDELVEFRTYYTMNDGKIIYFTKKEFLEGTGNILCITSPYQYENYKDWCLKQNIIQTEIKYNIYIIYIDTNIKIRINRLLERASKDDDIYEACRRCLDEKYEFKNVARHIPEIGNPQLQYNDLLYVDNNSTEEDTIYANLNSIKTFIEANV